MYFFNYFGELTKVVFLLVGLNNSGEKIDFEKACSLVERYVEKVQELYPNIPITEFVITKAKDKILFLSYQGQSAIELVEQRTIELEQKILFGHKNECMNLPASLKTMGKIYHYKVNDQRLYSHKKISCGLWCVVNAQAIDRYLTRRSSLKYKKINKLAKKFFEEMVLDNPPQEMLQGQDINKLACLVLKNHKLNTSTYQDFAESCDVENIKNFSKMVCANKLHIVDGNLGRISPNCFSCGESENKRILERLASQGSVNGLWYFLVLSNYLEERRKQKEGCCIHFVCFSEEHWILISVIYLPRLDQVFLTIGDSMNNSIQLPANYEIDLSKIFEQGSLKKNFYENMALFVCFFHKLFVMGNNNLLDEELQNKITEYQDSSLPGNDSDEDLWVIESIKNENDDVLNRRVVQAGYDAYPEGKGKEKNIK